MDGATPYPVACGPYGLPVGSTPDYTPELVITEESVDALTKSLTTETTLIISDQYNFYQMKKYGICIQVQDGSAEQVYSILQMNGFSHFHRVLGVGGCLALDISRSIAVCIAGSPLIVIPTILSTNCLTKNRSVIGHGLQSQSYQTTAPRQVIVSITNLLRQEAAILSHWSQSGWGDYFAKLGAMVDQLSSEMIPITLDNLRERDPQVMGELDWINSNFKEYNRESLIRLAENIHRAGLETIRAGSNDRSVGGEHQFYKIIIELFPFLRTIPSHGQIVSIGTLVASAALAQQTGSADLYNRLSSAFKKLGLPTRYRDLERIGIKWKYLNRAFTRLGKPDMPVSYLQRYFCSHDTRILDDVYGVPEIIK